MKTKTIKQSVFLTVFSVTASFAQHHFVNTPPEVSPMAMKPEMTEIWNPEVKVITPAKNAGEAPSDAIILFDGKNLDQWVNKKDNSKPAGWKISNNDYMEVVPGTGDIQTKMKFGDCQLHIEWSAPDEVVDGGQICGKVVSFFKIATNCKY